MSLDGLIRVLFESLEKSRQPKETHGMWTRSVSRDVTELRLPRLTGETPHLIGPASDGGVNKRGEPKRRVPLDLGLRYV
jgi:hypothetical protein